MLEGFRVRYRLHPAARLSALRQWTLNKTAINKDEVSIRTADSFNQIRNIKVPSKAKEKDEKVDEILCRVEIDIPRRVAARN